MSLTRSQNDPPNDLVVGLAAKLFGNDFPSVDLTKVFEGFVGDTCKVDGILNAGDGELAVILPGDAIDSRFGGGVV